MNFPTIEKFHKHFFNRPILKIKTIFSIYRHFEQNFPRTDQKIYKYVSIIQHDTGEAPRSARAFPCETTVRKIVIPQKKTSSCILALNRNNVSFDISTFRTRFSNREKKHEKHAFPSAFPPIGKFNKTPRPVNVRVNKRRSFFESTTHYRVSFGYFHISFSKRQNFKGRRAFAARQLAFALRRGRTPKTRPKTFTLKTLTDYFIFSFVGIRRVKMIRRALCKVAGFLQRRRGKGDKQKCQQCQQCQKCQQCQQCQQFQNQCHVKEKDDRLPDDVEKRGKGELPYEVRDSEVMGRFV